MKNTIKNIIHAARSNGYILFLAGFASVVAVGLFKLSAILETL